MDRDKILYYVDLYFPDIIQNGKIKPGITEEELNLSYANNKAMINMTRFNGDLRTRLNNLSIAYSYLLNMLNNPHSFIDGAFQSYYELINAIGEYGFVERSTKTTGQSQNEAQAEIMELLGNFNDSLADMKKTLKENDSYIKDHDEEFKSVVIDIEEQIKVLKEASVLYHNNLAAFKNGAVPGLELGRSKSAWRKERNRGLQVALDFIREVRALCEGIVRQKNIESGIRIKDYSYIPVNLVFMENMKKVRKSRVYYSFLTEHEKEDFEKGFTR